MATCVDRETKRRERPPPGSRLQDCEGETGKARKSTHWKKMSERVTGKRPRDRHLSPDPTGPCRALSQ